MILALAVYKGGVDERFDSRPSYNNSQYDNALELTEQRLRKLEQQADYDRQTREMEGRWWK